MKTRLSFFCMVAFLAAINVADAQYPCPPEGGCLSGGHFGGIGGGQSQFRQVRGDIQAGVPGRFWFETNVADDGLGYNGSYLTIGCKRRLYEDFLDGRWLMEVQAHHSIDDDEGDFFANIGLERVFSIPAAGADVSIGAWYDYNSETDVDFSIPFHQVGVSGKIKTQRWDLLGNGYFPTGDTENALGDPTGQSPFGRNFILREAGFDAAQTGFDLTLRSRPKQLAFANGLIDFGGYGYKSDLNEFFGGGRMALGFQGLKGAMVRAEVNYDDQFKTTGVLSIGWIFGANGGVGGEYAGLARDLEPTLRNDHIVRVINEAAFVINPVTGLPYNVLHVNNNGGTEGSGEGTFERPFLTLREAQLASVEGDAIFVDSGDGTSRNYQDGFDLKRDQLLLGDGGTVMVPDATDGGLFTLHTDGGTGPTITNPTEESVIELADNNWVAGINVDATGSTYGIRGTIVDGATVDAVMVQNAGHSGLFLNNVFGDFVFRNSTFNNNQGKGIFVDGVFNPDSTFALQNNIASNNILDGIRFRNFDAMSFVMDSNTTSNNGGHGLLLEEFANTAGNGINILNHTSIDNSWIGISVNGGSGKLNVLNPVVTGNTAQGIQIRNWASTNANEFTVVSGIGSTQATAVDNGSGAANVDIVLDQPGLTQNVLVTNILLSGAGTGLNASADGVDSVLNIDVLDNVSITNNTINGISMFALNGATVNANITGTEAAPLTLTNNGLTGGNGILLAARGIGGIPLARMNAVVQNVQIQNDVSIIDASDGSLLFTATTGVEVESTDNAVVDVLVADSTIGAPRQTPNLDVTNGVILDLDNDGHNEINRVVLDNLDLVVGSNNVTDVVAGVPFGAGITVKADTETLSDIMIRDSVIRPNGIPSLPGVLNNEQEFNDLVGSYGIIVEAQGLATQVGPSYFAGPGPHFQGNAIVGPSADLDGGFTPDGTILSAGGDFVSDGVEDNLTRIQIVDNEIRDFTFDGVDIRSGGDAQVLLNIVGNTIRNNGAGVDEDVDTDGVYAEEGITYVANNDPTNNALGAIQDQLLFYDGINIDAYEDSTISARISKNSFEENFERGLSINTFQRATINAIVDGNAFIGNDRGLDSNFQFPITAVGQDRGPIVNVTAGFFDVELINNEEYYFRVHESLVYVNNGGEDEGALVDPVTGTILDGDGTPGVPIPGNIGTDIFGTPVPFGTADLNVALVGNGIEIGVDAQDFSVPPGDFNLFADNPDEIGSGAFGVGLNGSIEPTEPTTTGLGAIEVVLSAEEFSFFMRGFEPPKQ